MKRPKLLAPTAQWDEYIERVMATFPSNWEYRQLQLEIGQRHEACIKRYYKTKNKVWLNRSMSCKRLRRELTDWRYPSMAVHRAKDEAQLQKSKKVKGYYAVIH